MTANNSDNNGQGAGGSPRDRVGALFSAVFILSFLAGLLLIIRGGGQASPGAGAGVPVSGPGIGVVAVRGVISVTGQGGFGFKSEGVQALVEEIRKMAESPLVRGLVVRIDSPGGAVAASQELYNAIRRFRATGKPAVASFGDVAASGGYYAACACDRIVANPGTTTGSIGVIMTAPDMKGLYDWVRVRWNVIKSGRFKDILSPYRHMTPEERVRLQALVTDAYTQFFDVVHKGRRITRARLAELAQGQVFTGAQAKKEGLVDEVGDFEHALLLAGRLAKIEGRPRVIRSRRRTGLADILGSLAGRTSSLDRLFSGGRGAAWGPGIYYLFRGY